jgi:hypothetical protein
VVQSQRQWDTISKTKLQKKDKQSPYSSISTAGAGL